MLFRSQQPGCRAWVISHDQGLRPGGLEEGARAHADCLLAYVLGKERSFLLAHDEIELSAAQERAFFYAVSRRNAGLPVAYITGTKEFFGFDFKVTPDVLIPKPDTELLVERTLCELECLAAQRRSKTDIAIGTASGSTAIDTTH